MTKYIARRLVQALPTLFGISLLSFIIMTAAPGGPTAALFQNPNLSARDRERMAALLGVTDPWPVQYIRWLLGDDWQIYDLNNDGTPETYGTRRGILRGDFGTSFTSRRPVMVMIGERVGATLELAVAALLIGLLFGIPIGILAAVRRGSTFDNLTRVIAVFFNAVPIFWLGLLLILIFGSWLRVLPMGSRCPQAVVGCPPLFERLDHLILPALVLATGTIAAYSRFLRASMLDVMNQDYMRTAQSKGLKPRRVWFEHGARNALIPIATLLGPTLTGLLGGAVITETMFSWPGLGRLAIQALSTLDYPVIMAVTIIGAVSTILGFLLSDILCAMIDPRIRFH